MKCLTFFDLPCIKSECFTRWEEQTEYRNRFRHRVFLVIYWFLAYGFWYATNQKIASLSRNFFLSARHERGSFDDGVEASVANRLALSTISGTMKPRTLAPHDECADVFQ